MTADTVMNALNALNLKMDTLKATYPGITLGYIGNCSMSNSARPFDDRTWHVFLPHPGRVGTDVDSVWLGSTESLPRFVDDGYWLMVTSMVAQRWAKGSRS